ncbi:pentapeptide repeat-containing protein [Streptosporangium minutum]|uniref:pentapeptide repeat-containing protein n=1 Tax=Streptosporangium minutum TaxID=569862 RepID=UPI0013FDE0CB|nr:pentapeptide repeat-containing protein [Streptosporangium minutum]
MLAHFDGVHGLAGKDLAAALDAIRGRALAIATGLIALVAVYYTATNADTARRTFRLSEQGHVTDRYTKAIEQLGSDKLDIRLGGIYALERIARDSARDHPTVMEVLAAFVREHSRDVATGETGIVKSRRPLLRTDLQAALTVIGRRIAGQDPPGMRINLGGADLTGADLTGATLDHATLTGADLTDATLTGVNLTRAWLIGVDLIGADLMGADLTWAWLTDACLTRANLTDANLIGATLGRVDLTGADLTRADLTDADLIGANLTRATLTDTDLANAILGHANLTDADLTDANLTRATLIGANLTRANLTDAALRNVVGLPERLRPAPSEPAGAGTEEASEAGPAPRAKPDQE